jgi:hypothetical protein
MEGKTQLNVENLGQRFERFAQVECAGSSPLYERISLGIANDSALLKLAAHAREGQPVPNLFLAAVHFLLLRGSEHPLSTFYGSLSQEPDIVADPYPHFRAFCLAHQDKIRDLISTKRVQTNVVRRSSYLFVAFGLVTRMNPARPLALVEIGTGAGLNLIWDRYGYDYGVGERYGVVNSPVQISCVLRGDRIPPLPKTIPRVDYRLGVDLEPIDVNDPGAALWLRALVWPEHRQRVELLREAIQLMGSDPPQLIAGDALDLLPEILGAVPRDITLCIFHTHTLNQFSPAARDRLDALFAEGAADRDCFRVSGEWIGARFPRLELSWLTKGTERRRLLAHCDSHGRWLEWLDAGSQSSVFA